MRKPQVQAQVIKSVTKSQLVSMAMQNYTGTTPELQRRQYEGYTKLYLALLVQQRAYFAPRGV